MTSNLSKTGVILWEGVSPIDGAPLVCVLTLKSRNRKTGKLAQTWIIRTDVAPHVAVATGQDVSCCGTCPLRPHVAGSGVRCYVKVSNAPRAVHAAYTAGRYPHADTPEGARVMALARAAGVRAGSYGDPAMVPASVWARLPVVTGYTHAWRFPWAQAHRAWMMASVDGPGDVEAARAAGWRTFEVARGDATPSTGAVQCPSDTRGITCSDCRLCGGLQRAAARSVWIAAHGTTASCDGPSIPQLDGRGRLSVWRQ